MQPSAMADPGNRRAHTRRRSWCCSFGVATQSPESRAAPRHHRAPPPPPPPKTQIPPYAASSHSSPSPSSKVGRGLMDPRRILSPGRVSPIDSDPPAPLGPLPEAVDPVSVAGDSEAGSPDPPPKEEAAVSGCPSSARMGAGGAARSEEASMDLRLVLKGKDGKCLVLAMDSSVLCQSSTFFAGMVLEARRKASGPSVECQKIDVAEIEDLSVLKDTIELMYEKDAMRWLKKAGVHRTIGILEVSSTIMFNRGVVSCLKYLEAVPWNESEEEKLKSLFSRCSFDEPVSQDLLARLYSQGPNGNQGLAIRLLNSVAHGTNINARKVLQTLVDGLLSKSSVYQKDPMGLNKEGLYGVCNSCLNSLVELFAVAPDSFSADPTSTVIKRRPTMIEQVSRQVDNLNWLLQILMDKQMAEDFVEVWANQTGLIQLHEMSSPMVRYELSRISASVFIALGRGKLHCPSSIRYAVLRAWFGPMLLDFGWLQRCTKGLDLRMLEESLGQVILTLSLCQQQSLFVEWFRWFSVQGSECPNLSKAFEVWWRRSFVRTSDARG
uniref:BTB/POZ domain-containing protein At2g13690 n=1 Tax=Anthurium amnicola TaxID=1678845 RepID=A0A1D1XUD2_9ARAE